MCGGQPLLCLGVRAIRERKWRAFTALLLASSLCGAIFWRLMDVNEVISGGMLFLVAGISILAAVCRRSSFFLLAWTWGFPIIVWFGCLFMLFMMLPFRMRDEVQNVVYSPDGRCKAVLSYYDGVTFGYRRILLEDRRLHGLLVADEVSEACESGLDQIAWRDAHTLVVTYSCPENELVARDQQWRNIRIVYERSATQASSKPGSGQSRTKPDPVQ